MNGEREYAVRDKRFSCPDLLKLQQSHTGGLVMTSAPYNDVMMSPRPVYSVCVCRATVRYLYVCLHYAANSEVYCRFVHSVYV